jgi:hypothetical protein
MRIKVVCAIQDLDFHIRLLNDRALRELFAPYCPL